LGGKRIWYYIIYGKNKFLNKFVTPEKPFLEARNRGSGVHFGLDEHGFPPEFTLVKTGAGITIGF
jgi:hypothetical protein